MRNRNVSPCCEYTIDEYDRCMFCAAKVEKSIYIRKSKPSTESISDLRNEAYTYNVEMPDTQYIANQQPSYEHYE